MNPFAYGPSLYMALVVSIILCFSAVIIWLTKEFKSKITVIDLIISVYFFYTITSFYIFPNPPLFDSKRYDILCLACIFLTTRSILTHVPRIKAVQSVTIGLISLTVVVCLFGLLQSAGILDSQSRYFEITGPFLNPARYANFIISILPFLLCYALVCPGIGNNFLVIRVISSIAFFLGSYVLFLTSTRAAWIGLFAAVIFILFYYRRNRIVFLLKKKWIQVAGILFIAVVSYVLFIIKPKSALGRLTVWEVSADIIKDHPVAGIGYGNFEGSYMRYQAKYFSRNSAPAEKVMLAGMVRYPYNVFIQVLCEQGLVGLILFLSLIASLLSARLFKNKKKITISSFVQCGCLSCLLAVVVSWFFSYPLDILPVSIVWYTLLAILSALHHGRNILIFQLKNKLLMRTLSVVLVSGAFFLFKSTATRYKALANWKYLSLIDKVNINSLEALYPILHSDADFIQFYGETLLSKGDFRSCIEILETNKGILLYPSLYDLLGNAYFKAGRYNSAEKAFLTGYNMIPNNFESEFQLVQFYYYSSQFLKARRTVEHLLAKPVKIPSYKIGEIKIKSKQILMQLQVTKKALRPGYEKENLR